MINVSNEFREKMQESRAFIYTAEITFPDGTEMTLNHDDMNLSGCGIASESGSTAFPIGNAICKRLTLALYNDDDRYEGIDFVGAEIRMTLAFELSATTETIDLGTFTVTEPETYGSTVEITAYDGFWKADKRYFLTDTFPMTARALYVACCYASGLSPQTPTFNNDQFVINTAPADLTYRQIIGCIAMLAGANAVCINDGVRLIPYDEGGFTANRYHTFTEHYNPTISTDEVEITGIQTMAGSEIILSGVEGYVLEITNPLIEGNEWEAVQGIGNVLIGMTFRPFSADLVSYPLAEIGDACYIVDYKGRQYRSFVTDIDFGFQSHTTVTCTAESAIRNASAGYASATQIRTAQMARRAAQTEISAYDVEMQRLVSLMTNSAGAFFTEEEDQNGGKIFYLHDKPTLAESEKIWKRTADGFLVSTDGGSTWNAGMDAYGNLLVNILSAIGVNADWVNTGALTVRDDSGAVIFQADITNRSIYMSGDHVYIGDQSATEALAEAQGLLTITLSNDTQAIPVDSGGDYAVFPDVNTEIRVYHGGTDVTSQATVTASPVNITGALTEGTDCYIYTPASLVTDGGYALISAVYNNGVDTFRATKRFNLYKAYAGATGPNGAPGADGRLYFIESDVDAFKLGQDDVFQPSTVTYSAYYRDGSSAARIPYEGRIEVEVTKNGKDWTTVIYPLENVTSVTYTPDDPEITGVRCRLYASGDFDDYWYGLATDETGEYLLVDSDSIVLLADYERKVIEETTQLDIAQTAVVVDVSALSQDEVFNILTDGGKIMGIYKEGNTLKINANYIGTGVLRSNDGSTTWDLNTGVLTISPNANVGSTGESLSGMRTRITTNADRLATEISARTTQGNTLTSRIDQNATSISTEVTNRTTEDSKLSSRITQNANGIATKVTAGEVNSLIDQKADSIRLKANKLSWSSNYSSMTQDGKLSATSGSFSGSVTASTISGSTITSRSTYGYREMQMSADAYLRLSNYKYYSGNDAIAGYLAAAAGDSGELISTHPFVVISIPHTDGKFGVAFKSGIPTDENMSCVFQVGRSGVYVDGNMDVSDFKARVVNTEDYGERRLYCYETASPFFGDIGDGVIGEDGLCYVPIDPMLLQTISVNQYQVFLQPYGVGACYVKERKSGHFIVEGEPGLMFGWELKAKQSDFDQTRLDKREASADIDGADYGAEAMELISNSNDYGLDASNHISKLNDERRAA